MKGKGPWQGLPSASEQYCPFQVTSVVEFGTLSGIHFFLDKENEMVKKGPRAYCWLYKLSNNICFRPFFSTKAPLEQMFSFPF